MHKSLIELLELRQKAADELAEVKLKRAQIQVELKSENLDEVELKKLNNEATTLATKGQLLKEELADLDADIKAAEEKLSNAAQVIREGQKGSGQLEYLKTKEAALDFARILMENEGSGSSARKAWEANLVEKGVTGLSKIIPEPILIAIEDAFVDYNGILNHVTKDPRYAVRIALQSQVSAAKGQKAGKTKKDEEFAFTDFTINSATVYIKYAFEYADLKKDTTGAYFNYVMKELAQGFIRTVERAVVIGDGKGSGDADKITEIKSIAEETEAALFDTQEIDLKAASLDQAALEALVAGLDKLVDTATPILVTSKAVARKLKLAKDADGRYLDAQPFAPISTTGNNIAGFNVYVYDWMDGAANPIIAFADKAYHMIGDGVAADRFEDYDVTVNRRHIELASVMGGRLAKYKSAVKFTAAL